MLVLLLNWIVAIITIQVLVGVAVVVVVLIGD
jgi:hypothetical protein